MGKIRLATTWLDGCSGCHMSFLDLDEEVLTILDRVELVYGPLVDAKQIPPGIDVALVEGAVSTAADREKILLLRERAAILVALGDCAVTANVPAMRNRFSTEEVLGRAYLENATANPQLPGEGAPRLLAQARPLHELVAVDVFIPGCPPPAVAIGFALAELLAGRIPDMAGRSRFGA
ncbi:MAG: NADP oxidoreductase [Desulfobacterales bacterium]